MLVRSGIILIKYWFSVSDAEQEARFQARIDDPTKRWKLSPMDLQSRARWVEYSRAKDAMFRCLRREVLARHGWYLAVHPVFDPYRDDPRFDVLLNAARLARVEVSANGSAGSD